MKTPNEMSATRFHHRHAGEDWVVVDCHDGEWCDVVFTGKYEVGNQFFRLWKRLLTVQKNRSGENDIIPDKLMEKIKDIRDRIESGKWKIVNTRLVKS